MASNSNNRPTARCSFCGRGENEVMFLIPSPTGLFICDNCVDACRSLIDEHLHHQDCDESFTRESLPKPAEIKVDAERAQAWIKTGAQPTETVKALLKKANAI